MKKLIQLLDIASNTTGINDWYDNNGYVSPYSIISGAIKAKGSDILSDRVREIVAGSCAVGYEGLSSFGSGLLYDCLSLIDEMEYQAYLRGLNVRLS